MRLGFVKDQATGYVMHRTLLKVIVNPVLRFIQFWTYNPFVIASQCKVVQGTYMFQGYTIASVYFLNQWAYKKYLLALLQPSYQFPALLAVTYL